MPWRGPQVKGEFPTLGYIAADFIESLPLPDRSGRPFRLYDEQLAHLLFRYRLNPAATEHDGNDAFQFGGSMLVRGQKWGKDPLAAADDLFHAFGPCDFAGWDANGEPVGRPNPNAWVAIAATNDEQTRNTWAPLHYMVENSWLAEQPGAQVHDTFIKLPSGNTIDQLTTTAFGRLGTPYTAASITEAGVLVGEGPRGGLTFARTLKRNVGGMSGMWFAVTNTWDPTEGSDAQLTYEAKDPHVYVDAKLARKRVDLEDDDDLRREIIHVYGDSIKAAGGHVSEQRIMRDCRNPAMGESQVRRFYLSEIVAGERDAIDVTRWNGLARVDEPLTAGEVIAVGFDGSRSRDATVLWISRVRDGRLFRGNVWLPEEHPDNRVPRTEVDQAVTNLFTTYDCRYLFADPFLWQDYLDAWAARYPDRVVEFPTNVEHRMDQLVERFQTAMRLGELTHDGDELLTQHAKNAAIAKGKRKAAREDDAGARIEHYLKLAKKRGGRIDAFVAAHLAYAARGQAIEDGALEDTTTEAWGFFE